jgi:hypothetical protein
VNYFSIFKELWSIQIWEAISFTLGEIEKNNLHPAFLKRERWALQLLFHPAIFPRKSPGRRLGTRYISGNNGYFTHISVGHTEILGKMRRFSRKSGI